MVFLVCIDMHSWNNAFEKEGSKNASAWIAACEEKERTFVSTSEWRGAEHIHKHRVTEWKHNKCPHSDGTVTMNCSKQMHMQLTTHTHTHTHRNIINDKTAILYRRTGRRESQGEVTVTWTRENSKNTAFSLCVGLQNFILRQTERE